MKIQLPDPDDMSVEEWFAHMRITLKSAEKVYQQMVKDHGIDNENGNSPWVGFRLYDELKSTITKKETDGDTVEEFLPKCLYLEVEHL